MDMTQLLTPQARELLIRLAGLQGWHVGRLGCLDDEGIPVSDAGLICSFVQAVQSGTAPCNVPATELSRLIEELLRQIEAEGRIPCATIVVATP